MSSFNNGQMVDERSEPAPPPAPPLAPIENRLVPPKRRSNTIWMVAGLVLILISAISAAALAQSFNDSVQVVVAVRPIAEGQSVVAEDLGIAEISTSANNVRAIEPGRRGDLVGLVAAGPIGQGSIVHPDSFVSMAADDEGNVVVGAALGPDNYPRASLQPGDVVRLIELSGGAVSLDGAPAAGGREITIGEIVEVVRLGGDNFHFSIRVGESSANLVVDRIASNQLSLALLEDQSEFDAMEPMDSDPIDTEMEDLDEGEEG